MTSDRKASLKVTATLGFSAGSFIVLIWIGVLMANVNRVLTYSVSVEDMKDWTSESERLSTNGLRFASFFDVWERNHERRDGVIRGMP